MGRHYPGNKSSKKKYKKKKLWSPREEKLLVKVWSEKYLELRSARKNMHIYEDMRFQFKKYRFDVGIEEIKNKIHNLISKYNIEKSIISREGGASTWQLYDQIHSFVEGSGEADQKEEIFSERKFIYKWHGDIYYLAADYHDHDFDHVKSLFKWLRSDFSTSNPASITRLFSPTNEKHNSLAEFAFKKSHQVIKHSCHLTSISLSCICHHERPETREQEDSQEKRKKKIKWNQEAEHLLIQLWHEYVGSLKTNKKCGVVYQEMANEMVNEGHNFTSHEVQVKIHNMTNKYKLEKRSITHNGGYSTWCYYDDVHSILNSVECQNVEEREEDTKREPEPDTELEADAELEHEVELEQDADAEVELEPELDPDQIEESMCSIEAIESYKPADPKEGRKRRRDGKTLHASDILKLLKESADIMRREAEDRRITDGKMLRLQKELVEIERERNDILKEMLS